MTTSAYALAPNPLQPLYWLRRLQVELGIGTLPLPWLEARYGKPESRFITVDGIRIHYTDEGTGPTLVLLHGVLASLHTWDGWVMALQKHYRIVRLDIPGFGLSGRLPDGHYHPDKAIPFLEKVRAALGLERFHLAGNSMGGLLSWLYAARYPQRVDKLILLDPVGYEQPLPAIMKLVSTPLLGNIGKLIAPRLLVNMNVREVYGDARRIAPGTTRRYHHLLLREGNREVMVEVFRTFRSMHKRNPLTTEIPRLQAEVLLIWGARDRWVPPVHVERWLADAPNLQLKVYADAGHIPMEEIPERSAQDAHQFLQGLAA
jgi:pimeloyl-ACP methyl ester carboxylesterase